MIAPISRRSSCAGARPIAAPIVRPRWRRHGGAPRASRGSRDDGGWSFALDPDRSVTESPALWQPEACAHVAIAEPAPDGFAAPRLAELIASADIASEIILPGEWHLVFVADGRRFRLWLRRFLADERLAYVNPADPHSELRMAVSLAVQRRFSAGVTTHRFLRGGAPGPSERWRLIQWLRLLDASAEGRSARDIAAALILDDAQDFSAADWDGSSERRRIARWHRAAVAMRDGGYQELLGAA